MQPTVIQRRLGHSSIKVTSDLYGHLYPEVDAGIADAVTAIVKGAQLRGNVTRAQEAEREKSLDAVP